MTILSGVRLGPYAIQALAGAGGMGEVYRAIDTRLDRTVAIKLLPGHVADSPTRRQRFEREARAISRLNHPHICTLYDIGEQDGVLFLVMEHLEGETLADRLLRGALPIDQVLRYAIEIADALDQAHRQGIVHRDLKPSNIMLTRSGVKLLDFGIAQLWAPDAIAAGPFIGKRPADTLTEEGTIVGTVQYMAPEQLEARDTDARTDIFALGAITYEMATGRPAFEGKSQAGVIASILERNPPPLSVARSQGDEGRRGTASPHETVPPLLDQVVIRCLAKDPDERWQTVSDLRQALEWITDSGTQTGVASSVPTTRRSHGTRTVWVAVSLLLMIAILITALTVMRLARGVPADARMYRFVVSPPEQATFNQSSAFMTVSPDGHSLAFIASSPQGNSTLWVRSLDSVAARQLPGSDGVVQPFWSPDSRFLAFGVYGKLKKIDVSSGLLQTLADVRGMQTGTWNSDDVIVFRPTIEGPLYRIAAAGGLVTSATTLDSSRAETSHNWPQFLPDGRHFLYLARSTQPEHDGVVYIGSLDATDRIRLLSADSQAVYAPPGYLLFMRANTLRAQPFDVRSFRPTGEPLPLAEEVERTVGADRGAFSVSQNGVLAYRPIGVTQLVWFDRGGRQLGSIGPSGHYSSPALSPDEKQIAVARLDPVTGTSDIWVIELARGHASQFTFGPALHSKPLWSPDGSRVLFQSKSNFYQKASSGAGDDEPLLTKVGPFGTPLSLSRDGRMLVYTIFNLSNARYDLWMVPLSGDRKPIPFSRTDANEAGGQLSPDGRWMAYVSDESGKNEVYVRSFPSGDGKWRLSVNGGIEPTWRRDGKELFYLATDRYLMAVALRTGSTVQASAPMRLFETRMANRTSLGYTRNQYLVTGDGQRFLINEPAGGASSSPITVVVNWTAALKR